ncbi:Rho GTPase-activating protein REN1, partial [Bienertia sinuspersici]
GVVAVVCGGGARCIGIVCCGGGVRFASLVVVARGWAWLWCDCWCTVVVVVVYGGVTMVDVMMKEQSMTSKPNDCSSQPQGPPQLENVAAPPPQPGPPEHQSSRSRNQTKYKLNHYNSLQVFKSGPLFISSKGIGWTSWKKRWFILTRTSLVFFRSDPSSAPQKSGDVNLTLGGIDLNNSASVEVKADKKLLTVFFPDGRDGRAFTLKERESESGILVGLPLCLEARRMERGKGKGKGKG